MRIETESPDELRRIAARLNELADSIEGTDTRRDRWLSTHVAADRAGVSYECIYDWCRRFGIGEKSPTGRWQISEARLEKLIGRK